MAPKISAAGQRGSALKAVGRTVSSTAACADGKTNSLTSAATPARSSRSTRPSVLNAKARATTSSSKSAQTVNAALSKQGAAAVRLQAWFRGHLGRCLAVRQRIRMEQRREDERHEEEERARRQQREAAKREAEEAARLEKERQKEEKLKYFREYRGAAELMCQALLSQDMPWEEDASKLQLLLESNASCDAETWLGRQSSRRAARKQYLQLARKWHPDKWSMQGEASVAVATDVTKCLVRAYEWMNKNLPPDDVATATDDADEEAEVYEFASWVGIAFEGMFEVFKERKGVTQGKQRRHK